MKKFLAIILIFSGFLSYSQNLSTQIQQVKRLVNSSSAASLKAQYLIKLGNLYQQVDSTDQAIQAYEQALALISNSKNHQALYQLHSFLGVLYSEKNNFEQAQKHFEQSVKQARLLQRKDLLSQALFNLANTTMELGNYRDAIKHYEEALGIAFDQDNLQLVKKAYAKMARCYKELGDQERYMKYFNLSASIDRKIKEQIIAKKEEEARKQAQLARQRELLLELQRYQMKTVQDSLKYVQEMNEKNKMKIALLEKEAKLKELQVKQREAELKKKEAELRAKQVIIISLAALLVIITVAIFLVLKLYRDKKKAYEQLEQLNRELEQKNKQLQEQNKTIEQQRKLLADKNKQIQDSIEYASRIQRAILPSLAAIQYHFPAGQFIYYLPRDVVSGDFYWFSDQGKYKFLALVDCTGHSVPGAFMSLIGNTLLNEIINTKHIFDPSEVLIHLHYEVVKMLHQQSPEQATIQDGMDIALCRFDIDENKMVFASANQPIFIFYPDGKHLQLNGDIYSIGGFSERIQVSFKNTVIELENGTNIYLSSDGYFDQFSEKDHRKFTRKRFVNMLKEIYHKPMAEQLDIIRTTFEKWKGDFQQLDDVLVIGVRYTDKEETERLRKILSQQEKEQNDKNKQGSNTAQSEANT